MIREPLLYLAQFGRKYYLSAVTERSVAEGYDKNSLLVASPLCGRSFASHLPGGFGSSEFDLSYALKVIGGCGTRPHFQNAPSRSGGTFPPANTGNRCTDLLHRGFESRVHLMLPISEHPPTPPLQLHGLSTVSFHIHPELVGPELLAGPRVHIVIGASVPETSVHKYGQFRPGEADVHPANLGAVVDAVPKPFGPQAPTKNSLWLRAGSPNPCHEARTGLIPNSHQLPALNAPRLSSSANTCSPIARASSGGTALPICRYFSP